MMRKTSISCCLLVAACDVLKPPANVDATSSNILPPGSDLPSVATNPELVTQITLNQGLSAAALAASGGVVKRTPGKAAGAPVLYWNFGTTPIEAPFAVAAPLYILATQDASGNFTPVDTHPYLLDTIPGDVRYSPIRRVVYVPVTDRYHGELLPTLAALSDALALGLVGEPVPAGTWEDLPVVAPGVMLEVSAGVAMPAMEVFAHGYRVDAFELGTSLGRFSLVRNTIPQGQASTLFSGVATGVPPTLPNTPDPQVVFQLAVPTTASSPYSPVTTEVDVRLATGIAPSAILQDSDLFTRGPTGAISAYRTDNVASFAITLTVTNKQFQFADGAP
jgi:hypothetical protein